MYYFSFGSFMDIDYIKRHIPDIKFVTTAVVPNWEVQFNHYAPSIKAGATGAEPNPGKIAYGVIYEVTEEEMMHLDKVEHVYTAQYFRQKVVAVDDKGKLYSVWLYRTTNPDGPFETNRFYLGKILKGAKDFHLPQDYIDKLQKHYDSLPED